MRCGSDRRIDNKLVQQKSPETDTNVGGHLIYDEEVTTVHWEGKVSSINVAESSGCHTER